MNEPWVVVVIALLTLLFGAPVMTALGSWIQARFGLLKTKTEQEADLARQVREQEYADMLQFRQDQQEANRSLRLEYRTLREAHEDLERKHDTLEVECRELARKVEHLNGELSRVRAENVTLKARVAELEKELFSAYQELQRLRRERGAT